MAGKSHVIVLQACEWWWGAAQRPLVPAPELLLKQEGLGLEDRPQISLDGRCRDGRGVRRSCHAQKVKDAEEMLRSV